MSQSLETSNELIPDSIRAEELQARAKKKSKIKMTHSELIPQEKDNYCICSILQGIFIKYGIRDSQDQIAANLSPTEFGHKVDDERITTFLISRGFDYRFYWHNETPFNEPNTLLWEISANDGFIAIGRHAQRVLHFADPDIFIDDPADTKRKVVSIYEVLPDLARLGGGFGLIKRMS